MWEPRCSTAVYKRQCHSSQQLVLILKPLSPVYVKKILFKIQTIQLKCNICVACSSIFFLLTKSPFIYIFIYILSHNSGADYLSVTDQRCSLFSSILLIILTFCLLQYMQLQPRSCGIILCMQLSCAYLGLIYVILALKQVSWRWSFQPTHGGNINQLANLSVRNEKLLLSTSV